MTGSEGQVAWAESIRRRVALEFDRVAAALRGAASGEGEAARAHTEAVLAILEEKRAEVLGRTEAGYYIKEWQEIGGQVRGMIGRDARFQALRAERRGQG